MSQEILFMFDKIPKPWIDKQKTGIKEVLVYDSSKFSLSLSLKVVLLISGPSE
jgi:hypothetical protein